MKAILLSLAASTATICNGFSQEAATKTNGASPAMAAVTANDRAYEEAYAKADVAALVGFFTEDAEYTSEDGRNFSGRASIEASLKDAFSDKEGGKISITADSVKLLAPEVAVEKGSTTVISADGESEALYTAIHVKKDGKWKISQLIETPMPETILASSSSLKISPDGKKARTGTIWISCSPTARRLRRLPSSATSVGKPM